MVSPPLETIQRIFFAFFVSPATHYCSVDRGSTKWELLFLNMTSSRNRTPDLMTLSPKYYSLGHMLASSSWNFLFFFSVRSRYRILSRHKFILYFQNNKYILNILRWTGKPWFGWSINSYRASRDNWCTMWRDGGCRVGEVGEVRVPFILTIRVLSYSN